MKGRHPKRSKVDAISSDLWEQFWWAAYSDESFEQVFIAVTAFNAVGSTGLPADCVDFMREQAWNIFITEWKKACATKNGDFFRRLADAVERPNFHKFDDVRRSRTILQLMVHKWQGKPLPSVSDILAEVGMKNTPDNQMAVRRAFSKAGYKPAPLKPGPKRVSHKSSGRV